MKRRGIVRAPCGSAFVVGVLVAAAVGALLAFPRTAAAQRAAFPHEVHARVFPTCTTCHAGVVDPSASVWPQPSSCTSCHDGVVKARVDWTPRVTPRVSNLRFTHGRHRAAAALKNPADSLLFRNCSACHVPSGAPRMSVQHAVVGQCLSCHGQQGSHVDLERNACATCHLRLTDAPFLTRSRMARFPKPQSHGARDFLFGAHGKESRGGGAGALAVSANCATCHARNLCIACHVNAPDIAAIRALGLDDRPPPFSASLTAPTSHTANDFQTTHGRAAQQGTATCAVCHTRASCESCHVGAVPRAVAALAFGGVGRANGVQLLRKPPTSHSAEFREGHGRDANVRPRSCETCHERATCLTCHRPDGGRRSVYHAAGFLTRHPTAAYSRAANCSDCHNAAQFCQSCHQRAGLAGASRLGGVGYHDAFRGFSLGHGQAARQSLESCASCHAERQCTACHSAVGGGFRFSPHGPGFNPARARQKNPSVCIACHGSVIPKG